MDYVPEFNKTSKLGPEADSYFHTLSEMMMWIIVHISVAAPASMGARAEKNRQEVPKVDNSNWAKTMEAIVLILMLIRGLRGIPLAYVVSQHDNVMQIYLAVMLN